MDRLELDGARISSTKQATEELAYGHSRLGWQSL
jgi:hypothetical protein